MHAAVRRWAGTVVLALALSAGCVAAGVWQWHRHEERAAAVDVVRSNYDADATPLATLVDGPGARVASGDVWRPVTVRGRYLADPVLLRNRPVDRRPAFHVLAPFVVDTPGAEATPTVLVVDRGWVPASEQVSEPGAVPDVPSGPVELVVRLRADEPPSTRAAPEGQVQAISVAQVRESWLGATGDADLWPAAATVSGYGALVSEDGSRPDGLGRLPAPQTDPGSHLSYAFQWWVFALGALVGCAVLIVREQREDAASAEVDEGAAPEGPRLPAHPGVADGERRAPSATRRPAGARGRSRRRSAEEEEDALLDAQEQR